MLNKKNYPAIFRLGATMGVALIWIVLLLVRRLGLHIDENNYFRMAHTNFFGDSAASNKPFLFYALNYLFMKGVGLYLGPLHAISLHLLYMALFLASALFLVRKLSEEQNRRLWLFIAICLSPFAVFNSTQLMMENAQYPVLAVLFALLIDSGTAVTTKRQVVIFLLAVLSVFIKETSVAALLVFAFAFRERKAKLWPLWAAAAIGVNLAIFASQGGFDTPQKTYGSLTELPGLNELGSRFWKALQFGWTFLFLMTLPLVAATVVARKKSPLYFRVVLASLVATLLIGFISKEDFVRYSYPVVFLALVSGVAAASKLKRWALPAIVAAGIIPIWNMWTLDDDSRLSLWPSILTRELYFSGFTVMPGVPLHFWSVFSPNRNEGLCLFVTAQDSEKPWAVANYFKYVRSDVRIFAESQANDFDRCQEPKAIVRRQYLRQPHASALNGAQQYNDCAPQCPDGTFVQACANQEMRGWAAHEGSLLTNVTCLP